MARRHRNDKELQTASDHLSYEFWMLEKVARAMAYGITGEGPVKNAFLESFCIHARVLMDFLYSSAARPDDVIAEDYFSSEEEWHKQRPQEPSRLRADRERVNKRLAHLTYTRLGVTNENRQWEILQIYQYLEEALRRFLWCIPQNRLGQKCIELRTILGQTARQAQPPCDPAIIRN